MKKLMTIVVSVGLLASQSYAQSGTEETAPKAVTETFSKKFPNATNVEWEKENKAEWEAEFKMNGVSYSANFDTDGTWTETEYRIGDDEIPTDILSTITNGYDGYTIKKVEVIENPKGTFYEVHLKKGEKEVELVMDSKGKVLKKEVEEEDGDDDED